ncbi:MAG: TIGR03790 family protein [Armatimonadetes bacterium]|nr:TIGR03790 family protein [Armatimonadota bacterium]
MKLKILAPLTIIIAVAIAVMVNLRPMPAGGAENVLVVRNGNSPVSCRITEYYMAKRNIARGNLVTVNVIDSSLNAANEDIPLVDYIEKIEKPISEFLKSNKLEEKVQYIVLTKGIPIRISSDSASGVNGQAVDSILAVLGCVKPMVLKMGTPDKPIIGVINRYWRSKEPFSHSKYGGYLVTRLDGYTEADAKALVDRALDTQSFPIYVLLDAKTKPSADNVSKQPISILNPDGTTNKTFGITYGDFDADMLCASQVISGREGVSMQLDVAKEFVSSDKPLTIYVSWGSNGGAEYKAEIYHSLKFAPRSIVETAVSSSGRTLLPTKGGQSLIADLISQGAAGAKGYVSEPYLHAMASPSVLVDFYTSGRNLAESYYAASRFIAWKDIVLGDPLCKLDTQKGAK